MSEVSEDFVQLVISEVRDPAIRTLRHMASGTIRSQAGLRWAAACADLPDEDRQTLISDAVDEVLFRVLERIDAGGLDLAWRPEGEQSWIVLSEHSDGWHGEYAAEDGFLDRSATEPHFPA